MKGLQKAIDQAAQDAVLTGSLESIAALVSDPAIASLLRTHLIGKPTATDRDIRATFNAHLLKNEKNWDDPRIQAALIDFHYDGRKVGNTPANKVFLKTAGSHITGPAKKIIAVLDGNLRMKARHLERLISKITNT